MKTEPISVTEAARNFSECVNRTRYQEVTFLLIKNGTPVAELTPTREKVCTGRDLAAVLAKTKLTDEEAKAGGAIGARAAIDPSLMRPV